MALHPPYVPGVLLATPMPHRHQPAEYCPIRRKWMQDGRALRNVKPSKAFVWPKDGRNGTTWGRFKDIIKNKGPDIYLTVNANKLDYMHNRPSRAQWSDHIHLDDIGLSGPHRFNSAKHAPWTRNGYLGGRMKGLAYDFRTREYGLPNAKTWTDAVWQPDPRENKHHLYPEAVRNIYGEWFQDIHYAPQHKGGPVDNEQGRGVPGFHLGPFHHWWANPKIVSQTPFV